MKPLPPIEASEPVASPMAQVAMQLRRQADLLESMADLVTSVSQMMVTLAETLEAESLDGTERWYPPEGGGDAEDLLP